MNKTDVLEVNNNDLVFDLMNKTTNSTNCSTS